MLLNLLAVIGIRTDPIKPLVKISATLCVGFYFASSIYCAVTALKIFLSSHRTIAASLLLLIINSTAIWCAWYAKRNKFSILIQKLYKFRYLYNAQNNSSTFIQITLIILVSLLLTLSQMKYFFLEQASIDILKFWSIGFEISEGTFRLCFIVFVNVLNFVTLTFPMLLTFILSTILYKYAEILHFYNMSLKSQLHDINKYKIVEILEDFLKLTKLLHKMNKIMNYPLFFIVLYSLLDIFVALHYLTSFKAILNYSIIAQILICFLSGMTMLVMYSVCSSMVQEKQSEIRSTAREKINEHVFGLTLSIPQNVLLCLRRIETETTIYISVCDMFRLSKSFILSAIGAIFTYDLLIISAFADEVKQNSNVDSSSKNDSVL